MLDLESLFKLSYGMYIISSKNNGKIDGCIVNTVFQITHEPPMIAVSVNRKCLTHQYIVESRVFAVSILSEQVRKPFIGKFGFRSGTDINKFEDVNYKTAHTGVPIILDNTVAFVEAEVTKSIDIKTHTLFIAKILACETLDDKEVPMTYAYYREVKQGRTPKTAATYIKKQEPQEGVKGMKKYKCLICGYVYNPEIGDPEGNIEAGAAFEDLLDDWICPECGAGKDEFEPIEE